MTVSVFAKLRGGDVPAAQVRALDNVDAVLRPMAEALSRTPIMGAAPVWTAMALDTAFVNLLAGFAVAAYYKDPFFRVWAKGVLTSSAGVGAGARVATFPIGFRVKETQRKAVEGDAATVQFLSIAPTGIVTVEAAVAPGGSLDFDFSFLAEQ